MFETVLLPIVCDLQILCCGSLLCQLCIHRQHHWKVVSLGSRRLSDGNSLKAYGRIMSAAGMLLRCFFSLRGNVNYWNDSLVCRNWPVASNWYHLSSYRCNDLVINRQFIALTLTLCDKWRLPAKGGVKMDQGVATRWQEQSWTNNFL